MVLRGFKIRKIRLNSYHVEIPFQTMTSRGYLISYLGILNVWGEDVSYCGPNIHFFLEGIATVVQEPEQKAFLEVLTWTFCSTNQFFHMLHAEGIWIPAPTAGIIAQHGYNSADPWDNPKKFFCVTEIRGCLQNIWGRIPACKMAKTSGQTHLYLEYPHFLGAVQSHLQTGTRIQVLVSPRKQGRVHCFGPHEF